MRTLGALALTAAVLVASSAHAAPLGLADVPLSRLGNTLPPAPPKATVPGLTVKPDGTVTEVKLARDAKNPACLFANDASQSRPAWLEPGSSTAYGSSFRVDRLLPSDDKPELERSLITVFGKTVIVDQRQRIPLRVVARHPEGVVVYAYRTGDDLWLLVPTPQSASVRHAASPSEVELDSLSGLFGSYDCGFVAARANVRGASAVSVELSGFLDVMAPGDKTPPRQFAVAASVSKVARDPAPVLSVTTRVFSP